MDFQGESNLGKKILDPSAGITFTHQHHDLGGEGDLTHVKAIHPIHGIVGEAVFEHQANGQLKPSDVQVHPDHRRKGIASAIYQHAQKLTGKLVQPSTAQTPLGQALWAGNKLAPQFGKSDELLAMIRMARLQKNNLYINPRLADDKDRESAAAKQMGTSRGVGPEFEAARFLANAQPASTFDVRRALYNNDGDSLAAALDLYGLPNTKENRDAVKSHTAITKGEESSTSVAPKVAKPVVPQGKPVADSVSRSIRAGEVQPIKLKGKHSSGSLLAHDKETTYTWLLKPNAGGVSKAAGVREEAANQARREAGYWHAAKLFGLEGYFPQAEAIEIITEDGTADEWAAIMMLPYDWRPVQDIKEMDNNYLMRVLEKYRKDGIIHQWAALNFILGNPDRHANNAMINGTDIMLIDQGSAFAGPDFAPGTDKNSFVPFYLRYLLVGKNFHKLSTEDKLKWMPLVDEIVDNLLRYWIQHIDPHILGAVLETYGINPEPSLVRLAKLSGTDGSMCEAINRAWAGVSL